MMNIIHNEVACWIFDGNKLKETRKKFLIHNEDFDAVNFYQQKSLQTNYPLIVNLAH